MKGEAAFYENLYKRNKGIFYRGSGASGKGVGLGALGKGVYLTWSEGQARAFASFHGQGGKVEAYKVKPGLKMLDVKSNLMSSIKEKMGFKPWEYSGDPMFAAMITIEAKDAGFDGVISDELAEGLVIFDPSNVEVVKRGGKKMESSLRGRAWSELPDVAKIAKGGFPLTIGKTPSGFMFSGTVPVELVFERLDGKPLTAEESRYLSNFWPNKVARDKMGIRVREFKTKSEALKAAKEIGAEVQEGRQLIRSGDLFEAKRIFSVYYPGDFAQKFTPGSKINPPVDAWIVDTTKGDGKVEHVKIRMFRGSSDYWNRRADYAELDDGRLVGGLYVFPVKPVLVKIEDNYGVTRQWVAGPKKEIDRITVKEGGEKMESTLRNRSYLSEAASDEIEVNGKKGVWRRVANLNIFFPSDGSDPVGIPKPKDKHQEKKELVKTKKKVRFFNKLFTSLKKRK